MFSYWSVAPLAFLGFSALASKYFIKKGANKKVVFISQISSFGLTTLGCFAFSAIKVFADGTSSPVNVVSGDKSIGFSIGLLAAALALGLAGLAAGIALSSAIPAAIAAMSENDKTFGKSMILTLFGEAIALYGFLIAIFILNKS